MAINTKKRDLHSPLRAYPGWARVSRAVWAFLKAIRSGSTRAGARRSKRLCAQVGVASGEPGELTARPSSQGWTPWQAARSNFSFRLPATARCLRAPYRIRSPTAWGELAYGFLAVTAPSEHQPNTSTPPWLPLSFGVPNFGLLERPGGTGGDCVASLVVTRNEGVRGSNPRVGLA